MVFARYLSVIFKKGYKPNPRSSMRKYMSYRPIPKKAMDNIWARLDSLGSSVPSGVVAHDIAHLPEDKNHAMEGQRFLSNEMDLPFQGSLITLQFWNGGHS